MEPNLTYLFPHAKVEKICEHLRNTEHNAFPVVSVTEYKNLMRLPTVPTVGRTPEKPIPSPSEATIGSEGNEASSKHSKRDYGIVSQQISRKHQLSGLFLSYVCLHRCVLLCLPVGAEMASLDQGYQIPHRILRNCRGRAHTIDCHPISINSPVRVEDERASSLGRRTVRSYPGHGRLLPERDRCVESVSGSGERTDDDDDDGVFNPQDKDEVLEEDRKVLMFHGIILRSQLVALLRNEIWVDEDELVSKTD